MKTESSSSQAIHVITVILTLIFCVGAFHLWLPEKILEKAKLVLKPKTDTINVAGTDKDSEIPQSLLDHIEKNRQMANSESDQLEEDELLEAFKKFHEDYSNKANEIIANRFKHPNLAEDNFEGVFKTPEGIKEIFTFWTHIFGVYNRSHIIFYNQGNVGIVYSVLDFSELTKLKKKGLGSVKTEIIREERRRIVRMLKNISTKFEDGKIKLSGLNLEEKRIAILLLDNSDHIRVDQKSLLASLKYRNGFSHRIKKAIVASGHYMQEMRRIFKERGLPPELTMIPFVESAFSLRAYSRAGAAGIWQFIHATGKRYLRIDEFVDERYDPILAAYAAATHLSHEYKLLGSWPLTVNAYNTGPGRMLQAIKRLQTRDIATIIKHFRGAGYGFDSRNYFPEILAAIHVYQNQKHYFGELRPLPPQKFEYVAMPSPMNINELAKLAGISPSIISNMNLAIKPEVLYGQKRFPKGYLLKIPPGTKQDIMVAMQELYRDVKYATHHIVRRGDTLKKISKLYEISVTELASANNVLPNQRLKKGTIIQLPGLQDFEYSKLDANSEMVVPDKLNIPEF